MSAKILDGKIVRDKIAKDLTKKIERQETKPKLVIVQVGDLPESNTYIKQKILFGEKIGAIVDYQKFNENITQKELITKLKSLNDNPSVHGIIIQLPVPKHLSKDELIETIDPKKDIDGQTATNLKTLLENKKGGYMPATTKGIITLLHYYQIPIHGKNVTVVGRSSLVGKPTAMAFMNLDATVTVAHSKTKKLSEKTKNADILIVAAGKEKLIKAYHVNTNQVVIDVGINIISQSESAISTRKLTGDVDFEEVSEIVAAITPVPGGIGPMTVASLFQNLTEAQNR